MIDEQSITDNHLAALYQYLGIPCLSCSVNGPLVEWKFRCPRFDAEAVREDFGNRETTVILGPFLKALNEVNSFRNKARQSLEGMWRSDKYADRRC
jgi:hypothetical protein